MARGNDATEAARELRERYGEGVGNAEDIIRSSHVEQPPALRRASLKKLDDEATTDLDLESLGGKVDGKVLDAAVRGGDTVIVWMDDDGRTHKTVMIEGKDEPEVEDRHLERIRNLAEQNEEAAKEREGEEAEPTLAEQREEKEKEEAARQAAPTSRKASRRAKSREGDKAED